MNPKLYPVILSALVLIACSSGGGGGSVERPFAPAEETVAKTYEFVNVNGSNDTMTIKQVGTKTIAGVEWPSYKAGKHDGLNTDGPEIWMEWGPEEVVVAGGEIRWDDFGLTPAGTPVISGTFDSPVTVPLDVPVGEPQTVHATGEAVVGDPLNPVLEITVDHDLDYTLVEEDVTADTPMGPVSGCKRYTGSTVVEGVTYEGEIVFHPTLGLVGGWVNWPDPDGARVDLRDIVDLGTGAFGDNELQGMALVGPDSPRFELNTYDVNGTLDADKDQHAKMLLELRYADETMAMSDTQPPLNVEFGTAWGYFPHTLIPSPVSIFHPEENGKGYTFWTAFVDQAAKNQEVNGIAYRISVDNPDYNTQAVRVTARIYYHLYAP